MEHVFWMQTYHGTKTLQTPNNPIRRPNRILQGLFPDCKSAERLRCRPAALTQVFLFLLLNKTWANGSVVTQLAFSTAATALILKTLVPKKLIPQSKSQNPWILLTTRDWREQQLAPSAKHTNRPTASHLKPVLQMCDTTSQTKLWNKD